MEYRINSTNPYDYLSLRERSFRDIKDVENCKIALENSLFTVGIYENNLLVAFGRVLGDGGIVYVISDIMVDSSLWRKGYGSKIMEKIDEYLDAITDQDSYVCLIARNPADQLYEKFNFEYLVGRCGMLRKQK